MSLDSARARFQRRHRELFRDEARIERPSGTSTLNPTTGELVPDPPTLLYEGRAQFRAQRWDGTDVMVGGGEVRLKGTRLHLPKDTEVQHDDLVTCTVSTFNADLVGRIYRVTDVFLEGWQVVRTCLIEEVT